MLNRYLFVGTEYESFNNKLTAAHIIRVLSVLPAAAMVTLILVLGMARLIQVDPDMQAPALDDYVVPSPILVERDLPPVVRAKPEPPIPAELPPELPKFEPLLESEVNNVLAKPNVSKAVERISMNGYSGSVPIPTVMVQPSYPTRAANNGIEGFVEVRFDVTAMGSTENIIVVASEPKAIFDSEAIKAVRRWRFSPVIVDGKAERYNHMHQRLVFEMAKG